MTFILPVLAGVASFAGLIALATLMHLTKTDRAAPKDYITVLGIIAAGTFGYFAAGGAWYGIVLGIAGFLVFSTIAVVTFFWLAARP